MNQKWTTYEKIEDLIQRYAGRVTVGLRVVGDPEVRGVYAARATFSDTEVAEFLVRAPFENVDDVDEVTFESWPPYARV